MKIDLKKIVASLLTVAFLWSTVAMAHAPLGAAGYTGCVSIGMAEMPVIGGSHHRAISDMSVPEMIDMHCDKSGNMGDGCSNHCNLCCASIAQYSFPGTAYTAGPMPAPAFFVAGIVIPTQERPPRLALA